MHWELPILNKAEPINGISQIQLIICDSGQRSVHWNQDKYIDFAIPLHKFAQ